MTSPWRFAVERSSTLPGYKLTLLPPKATSGENNEGDGNTDNGNDSNDNLFLDITDKARVVTIRSGTSTVLFSERFPDPVDGRSVMIQPTPGHPRGLYGRIGSLSLEQSTENTWRRRRRTKKNNNNNHQTANCAIGTTSSIEQVSDLSCRCCGAPIRQSETTASQGRSKAQSDETYQQQQSSSTTSASPPSPTPTVLRNVIPLPDSEWEEIAEDFTCVEAQESTDFAALSNARQGIVFEDMCFLVYHRDDLIDTAVCVLATPGYGSSSSSVPVSVSSSTADSASPTDSSWGSNEGSNVVCATCCSPIGYQRDDGIKLVKHRIHVGPISIPSTPTSMTMSESFVIFLSNQMVRYAESRAVYNFLVMQDHNSNNGNNNNGNASAPLNVVLLSVLSWNTEVATGRTNPDNDTEVPELHFVPLVKIVVSEPDHETMGKLLSQEATLSLFERGRGPIDFCCPPGGSLLGRNGSVKSNNSKETLPTGDTPTTEDRNLERSVLRIVVDGEEYDGLRNALRDGQRYDLLKPRSAIMARIKKGKGTIDSSSPSEQGYLSHLPLE